MRLQLLTHCSLQLTGAHSHARAHVCTHA